MEYEVIINFLDNKLNQDKRLVWSKWWLEWIVFKLDLRLMFKSNLCDYTNAYILTCKW